MMKFKRQSNLTMQAIFVAFVSLSVFVRCYRLILHPSLWGEDTIIYIADVLHLGWKSLIVPANGYQTLFSRLCAVTLAVMPLRFAEIIFNIGSAVALGFTLLVLWLCLPIDSKLGRVVACAAFVWMPCDSLEIFFALVNVNWPLSIALIVLVTSQTVTEGPYRPAWLPALFILTLCGPVCIIILPIMILRGVVFRDLVSAAPFYSVYALGAGLQLYTILKNSLPRLVVTTDWSAADWAKGLIDRTLMGFFSGPVLLVLTVLLLLWFLYSDARKLSVRTLFQIAALPMAGGLCLASSYYAVRDIPALVGPYALHARYFIIPFGLALCFILAIGRDRMRYAGIALVMLICAAGHRPYFQIDFGSPEEHRASGASRAPTYLGVYLKAARYIPNLKFYGRPGHEDFTLILPGSVAETPPVRADVTDDIVSNGRYRLPPECTGHRYHALAVAYSAEHRSVIGFNVSGKDSWYTQYRSLDPGEGVTVFAAPIDRSPEVELTPTGVDVHDAQVVCF